MEHKAVMEGQIPSIFLALGVLFCLYFTRKSPVLILLLVLTQSLYKCAISIPACFTD